MISTAVAQATDQLLQALRGTDAFIRYASLKESVMADEMNRGLLKRFTRAQSALQMAAMAGGEPREEDADARTAACGGNHGPPYPGSRPGCGTAGLIKRRREARGTKTRP